MIAATPDVLIDPAFDEATRVSLVEIARRAREVIAEAFGGLKGPVPLTIFCKGEESRCAFAFAGGPRPTSKSLAPGQRAEGATYVPTRKGLVVLIEPSTDVLSFTVHEQTHVEFFHRLGEKDVPQWFAEGVAVFVSAQKCRDEGPGVDDLTSLSDPRAWGAYTRKDNVATPTYCQAGAEIEAWLARRKAVDGVEASRALVATIEALAAGRSFEEAYGPLANPGAPVPVVMTRTSTVGDSQTPFTLALLVRPQATVGTLATLSSTSIGTGACTSLLGFDSKGQLVAQLFGGGGREPKFFFTATGPSLSVGRFSHVAMTWAPGKQVRLFVDGLEVAAADAPRFVGPQRGGEAFATWGSFNTAGPGFCWPGHVVPRRFEGLMTDLQLVPRVLSSAEVASLAASTGLVEPRATKPLLQGR